MYKFSTQNHTEVNANHSISHITYLLYCTVHNSITVSKYSSTSECSKHQLAQSGKLV